MNSFTDKKINEVLDYLCDENLEKIPNTPVVRNRKTKGINVFSNTDRLLTIEALQDLEYQKIFLRSFAKFKSNFDIHPIFQITSKKRK